MLIVDGVKYKLWIPKDEEREFHPMVKEHSKEIFGEDALYFDVKLMLKSKSGIASIPDAYVISLSKPFSWFIIENELASHRVYDHIVPQISKFIDGIDNLSSQREIRDVLYERITKDRVLKATVENAIHPEEIHHFLSTLVSKPPKLVVIIDEVTEEAKSASTSLRKLADTKVVEFKTFVREDAENVRAHVFEQLWHVTEAGESKTARAAKKAWQKRRGELPEHYENWDKMLAWVDESTKNIVSELTIEMLSSLGKQQIAEVVHGRYKCFYKGKPSTKSIFAAFLLTKKALKVRIRTDPERFEDPNGLTGGKVYRGWFFKQGQEREFKVTSGDLIFHGLELIKQSYALAK